MQIGWIGRLRALAVVTRNRARHGWRWAAVLATVTSMAALTAASAQVPARAQQKAATLDAARPVSCGPPRVLPPVYCYTPKEYELVYGVTPLLRRGIDGRGQTVAMPELANSPTRGVTYTDIRRDLASFDKRFGLPAATLHVDNGIAHARTPYLAGTEEVEDAEIIHAIAPGATLEVILVPKSAITSVANFMAALTEVVRAAITSRAAVLSISASADEHFVTHAEAARLHAAIEQARDHHVTVAASSGDSGAVSDQGGPKQVSLPASDPLVLAVGGTTLNANFKTGIYAGEMAWNSYQDATGGGYSQLFSRPSYQNGVPHIGATRGVPDVAADANNLTAMALAFTGGGILPARGTSAATPLWAAVVALADQQAGHPLGFVNPPIYHIARGPAYHHAFHDVQAGDNSVMLPSRVVVGYEAGPGWDPATGWGSPNAQYLVPLLAHGTAHS